MENIFDLTPEQKKADDAFKWFLHQNGADLPNDGGLINPFEKEKQMKRRNNE